MKRAKKNKVEAADVGAIAPVISSDDEDAAGESLLDRAHPPPRDPSPLLERSSSPDSLTGLEAGVQHIGFGPEERERRARMDRAKRAYDKAKRRWERKLSWVVEGKAWDGPHSLWRHASEVKRDEGRLAKIDDELQTARRFYAHCRGQWLRWRSFARLYDSRDRSPPGDPALMETLLERARVRVVECRVPSNEGRVIDMWPGVGHNLCEWNARSFGLAIAYGIEYNEPGVATDPKLLPTAAERAATAAAYAAFREEHSQRMQDRQHGLAPAAWSSRCGGFSPPEVDGVD